MTAIIRRVGVAGAVVLSAMLTLWTGSAQAACAEGQFCAGAASVDMTWHVGAGQGQYGGAGNGLSDDRFDPFHHSTKMVPSHGMQSRLYTKALVVQGPDGTKAAVVKVDVYLQQDVLTRRVAELVSGGDPVVQEYVVPGLDGERIILGATHNHSAPEYASTAWGVWLFTDTIDFRMFETTARKIAQAIKEAADALEPANMGATVLRYGDVQQNILGPGRADDGTPAGFPRDHFDDELAVVRFENADSGAPIAAWVTLGMHPESLEGSDFLSSDFTGMVEREIERGLGKEPGAEDGPVVVWIQGSVGDVEPDKDGRAHPQIEDRHYWHRDFAQAERMSRDLGQAVLDAWTDVVTTSDPRHVAEKHIPLSTDHPVAMVDYRFSGPPTHPVGTVSNCRTTHPGMPIIGLPDCERFFDPPEQYGTTIELLQDAGLPVPDNYSPPSYGAVQESLRIHLQALRIGEIIAGTMPGEPISDMVKNFKSRADRAGGEMYLGYEWDCDPNASTCDFRQAGYRPPNVQSVDPDALDLMYKQIRNDAAGWEDDLASLQGESEAQNPDDIYGNFTHEEIQDLDCGGEPCAGYTLPIGLGQTNDYIGYIVTYREYMSHDHYRKALTAFGPHTADYINTRLVRMAAQLRGSSVVVDATLDPAVGPADDVLNTAKALAAGAAGGGLLAASEAALPNDGGAPGPVTQPEAMERFDGARFSWIGGSNWTDNPEVVVEKLADGGDPEDDASWTTVATQEGGEVVLQLKYDSPFSAAPMDWLLGNKVYQWTAVWEAFETTAPGTYRFLVNGHHRSGGGANPYVLASNSFGVDVWRGIQIVDTQIGGGTMSFRAAGVETEGGQLETDADAVLTPDEIHYPDSYDAGDDPYVQVSYETHPPHTYCYRCAWRAWADTGQIAAATVEVNGTPTAASLDLSTGVFSVSGLTPGDTVAIPAGGVTDEYGNTNGASVTLVHP